MVPVCEPESHGGCDDGEWWLVVKTTAVFAAIHVLQERSTLCDDNGVIVVMFVAIVVAFGG